MFKNTFSLNNVLYAFFVILLLLIANNIFKPFKPTYTVTKVIDGDTIVISDNRHIRYIGIDSPEGGECFAARATIINNELVLNKKVTLETDNNDLDQFGRTLAYVYINGTMVNEYLLQQGTGTYFADYLNTKHQSKLIKAAEFAHTNKVGLWNACATEYIEGCIIKGNLDPNDKRFYHLPNFRHYNQVVMNLEKGDRWFCTEKEAIKAGFKRARE